MRARLIAAGATMTASTTMMTRARGIGANASASVNTELKVLATRRSRGSYRAKGRLAAMSRLHGRTQHHA
jgi:hypothetical protein